MPKSWYKWYQWILQHKTLLDNKYEELRVKVNEVEKQQEEDKIRIEYQVTQSKKDLVQQHAEIIKKHQDMQKIKRSTQENINHIGNQHNKYAKKIRRSKTI